ncbi:hypothetical protein [Corallococcus macrosporus]|uniref:Endonuclease/exonuclease/phosphatase domain-containing protein n=1 Tax=Corallococcus macrosporus DSM 14697 TaxID=1189310 RepID=A0A250K501_9BACT|nr:hypothetical protein [Corallococcus macrosporus]ATB51125.1 hypothetical protein MYMAC_006782 [Corallococcus macrosporus DSM 14697]
MPVRILSWNIFNFAKSLWSKAEETTRVLELLHPAGNDPAYDVFVIIEPVCKRAPVGDVAEGSGPDGAVQLLAKLRARHNGRFWRAITPLCIYAKQRKGKGEAVCVLYNSRTVAFVGPDTRVPGGDEWETLTAREGTLHWVDQTTLPHSLVEGELHQGRGAVASFGIDPKSSCIEPATPHLYWMDHRAQGLSRCDLDGANVTQVLSCLSARSPSQCVPAPGVGEVYWVDASTHAIWSTAAPSGASTLRVAGAAAGQPVDLRVAGGQLFWIEGASGSIRRADLDGQNVTDVVSAMGAGGPRDLTVIGGNLAWVATATQSIRALDTVSMTVQDLVLTAVAGTPRSLGAHLHMLYWVDGASGEIRGYDVSSSTAATVVATAGGPAGLLVAPSGLYWDDGNDIHRANLDGSHPGSIIAVGGAPRGLHEGNGVLYWVNPANDIYRANPDGTGQALCVAAADAGQPRWLGTDNARLYWVDAGTARTVRHANLDGSHPDALPAIGGAVCAHSTNGLFWVDGMTGAIWSSALDGTGATLRVSAADAGAPVALAVSDTDLYWADASRQELRAAPLATYVAATCVASADAGQPTSLAVSNRSDKLYWVDGATHTIRQAELDGSTPEDFVEAAAAGQPTCLTVGHDHDFVSWVDSASNELRWTPTGDGDAVQVLVAGAQAGMPGPHRVAPGDSYDPQLLTNVLGGALNWRILNERESCPFLVQFKDLSSGHLFNLVAQHAPSPTYGGTNLNRKARDGVSELLTQDVFDGTDPVTRIVYVGDLNLCGVPNPTTAPECTNDDADGHSLDRGVLQSFTNAPVSMTLVQSAVRSSLKKGRAVWDQYREHAYDNIIAKGHVAAANAHVIDLVAGVLADYRFTKGLGPTDPIADNVFNSKSIFLKIRLGKTSGISDHLPVTADFTY